MSFFSLISRFWELGIGGLLAFDKIKKPKDSFNEILGFLGFFLVLVSLLLTNKENFPGIFALPACLGAALMIFSEKFIDQLFLNK